MRKKMRCGNCNCWSRKGSHGTGDCSKKDSYGHDARIKQRGSDQGGCWEPKSEQSDKGGSK